LYETHPALTALDLPAVTRYASLSRHYRRLAERVAAADLETAGGKLREIVKELRAVASILLVHEEALALTPRSRSALGINLAHLKDLAAQMSEGQR
jgi:hypothetical protein